jgi:hypothetical protein
MCATRLLYPLWLVCLYRWVRSLSRWNDVWGTGSEPMLEVKRGPGFFWGAIVGGLVSHPLWDLIHWVVLRMP